jgi:hypothetical protein
MPDEDLMRCDDSIPSGNSMPTQHDYAGAACGFGHGLSFMEKFDMHEHAGCRKENLYYPFASKPEWALASWLLHSNLSMAAIDDFFSLEIVSTSLLQTSRINSH